MAKFIGSELITGNYGEDTFCQALIGAFPDNYIIYRNRQVFGREFDMAMLIPNVGIVVFEIKGWRESTVLRIENGDTMSKRSFPLVSPDSSSLITSKSQRLLMMKPSMRSKTLSRPSWALPTLISCSLTYKPS